MSSAKFVFSNAASMMLTVPFAMLSLRYSPIARIKTLLWWALLVGLLALTIGMVVGLGRLVLWSQSGADPATALNLIPVVPADLEKRLIWLSDRPQSAQQREMESNTRELITGSYLRAWAQWGIALELGQPYGLRTYFSGPALVGVTRNVTETAASGWTIRQSNLHHELELHYYSDDGSIVAFTDSNIQLVQHYLPQTERTDSQAESAVLRSDHRYDVVMLLEDGNWRIYQWRRLGNATPFLPAPGQSPTPSQVSITAPPGLVTLDKGALLVDGEPFVVAGVNYYPQAAPWTDFWPTYNAQQTSVDFERIRNLGLNTIRIFLPYEDFGDALATPQQRAKLADLLSRADLADLKVIITLFDHHTDHHPATWAADARHLATLIPAFATHPAILAWDLKNEPDRDYEFNTQPLVDAWLRFIADHLRRHDPHHLITIGWSTPEAATALTDVVDIVAYHYFDEAATYGARIAALQASAGNKPLLLQEFAFSTWNSPFYPGHTELEQQNYYAAILNEHATLDSLGYLLWTLYDFDHISLAQFRYPWQRAMQANMGVIRRDGTAKPAAALISPQAERNLVPLPSWYRLMTPFWLFIVSLFIILPLFFGWRYRRRS